MCLKPTDDTYQSLKGRFTASPLLSQVREEKRERAFVNLAIRYAEPWRWYHTLAHIRFCLKVFDDFKHLADRPNLVELALFYHDVVYNISVPPRQNEQFSAALAVNDLVDMKTSDTYPHYVAACILATTHDHEPDFRDGRFVVDIDLAGLGQPWPVFLQNNNCVREEYKEVPEDKFREGNGKVLQRFLDRTPMYYHPEIEARFGAQARENLTRWLNRP